MKIVIQRVRRAEVRVAGEVVGRAGAGMVLLVGIEVGDDPAQVDATAKRVLELRIFADREQRMNRSCREIQGDILAVSQFTLAASLGRGRRPGFDRAAPASEAEPLFRRFVDRLRESELRVETGQFGAMMEVELVNDGPVTFIV